MCSGVAITGIFPIWMAIFGKSHTIRFHRFALMVPFGGIDTRDAQTGFDVVVGNARTRTVIEVFLHARISLFRDW